MRTAARHYVTAAAGSELTLARLPAGGRPPASGPSKSWETSWDWRSWGIGLFCCGFGQAKIQELNLPVGCDPDVGWFEVAADDALFVRGLQAGGDLAGVIQRRLERQWAAGVRTFDELHHDGAPSRP